MKANREQSLNLQKEYSELYSKVKDMLAPIKKVQVK